jgi:hypothetical protein
VPQLTIREGGKRKQIYLTKEQREEVERIKFANGLRSLKEAYEVLKEAKEKVTAQFLDAEDVAGGIRIVDNPDSDSEELQRLRRENRCLKNQLEDPDVDEMLKLSEENWELKLENKSLRNQVSVSEVNLKICRKAMEELRLRLEARGPKKRKVMKRNRELMHR